MVFFHILEKVVPEPDLEKMATAKRKKDDDAPKRASTKKPAQPGGLTEVCVWTDCGSAR